MKQDQLFSEVEPVWPGPLMAAVLELEGIGPATLREITNAWPDPAEYDAEPTRVGSRTAGLLPRNLPEPISAPAGVRIVGLFDPDYPPGLKDLATPPPVIWVRGLLPGKMGVAVVGTRDPSAAGEAAARAAALAALELDRSVISGLARGIDGIAHRQVLETGGHTTAVLAGSLLEPTPSSNRHLAELILERGGCLMSEVPPWTEATRPGLIARNRIQAALSSVVVSAQSGLGSGTLHTIRFALELGRRVIVTRLEPSAGSTDNAGNEALANSDGFDPTLVGAKGSLAQRIGFRSGVVGVADTRPELREQIRAGWS